MRRIKTIWIMAASAVFTLAMAVSSYATSYIISPGVTLSSPSDDAAESSENYATYGSTYSSTSVITAVETTAPSSVSLNNTSNTESIHYTLSSVTVDPITELTPMIHAQLLLGTGNLTDGFTTNMGLFTSPEDGFAGLCLRYEEAIGDIFYRVYRENLGWGKWAMNEMITPFLGESSRVTAFQIRTNGYTSNNYSVYYRAVLDDGSVLGWARDGQSAGTIGEGRYIQGVQIALYPRGQAFPESTENHFVAANYEGVVMGTGGQYTYSTWDGQPYTGWAYDTSGNKYYFVNSATVTGWQYIDGYKYYFDAQGCVVTDLEPVIGLQDDYKIMINKEMKTMTIYAKDGDNGYIMPVKVILNTIGPDTPIGTFETYEKYRWKFMHDDLYCQFLLRFKNGFLLHSIIYEGEPTSYNLIASTYNYLGKNQSDGCVRMLSGDAYWVYTNCGLGTTVEIYEDEWVMGPFDRPAIEQAIPFTQNYDPTDPVIVEKMQEDTVSAAAAVQEAVTGEEARPTEIVSD